ncbi:MAG: hypothetical protein F6K09_08700 [Merismopedia sp. SIO2A8]|nr:hypothetical protein [Symploca sp. SIO2B6]NET48789.1 hypothetical protein [Merismopedia sp. SIO2A8]
MMRKMSQIANQRIGTDVHSGQRVSWRRCIRVMSTLGVFVMSPLVCIAPVLANPNFGSVTIAAVPDHDIAGHTGGTVSLAAIAPQDSSDRPCIGYAGDDPDHVLVFENTVSSVTIEVDSGEDTTLLIRDPNGTVYCGDDEGNGSDALIQGQNWGSGSYEVWVGAFQPGVRYDYTLRVNQ